MIVCPYCAHDNIEGVDFCEDCGHSLVDHHIPIPATSIERSLVDDKVSTLRTRAHVTVPPDMPVREVLKKLMENSTGCTLVVEGGKLVGIFSERDALLKLNTRASELGAHPVSEYMTRNPQVLHANDKIAFAVQRMDLGGYRHVPIVDDNEAPVGIISVRDILDYLTEKMAAEAEA